MDPDYSTINPEDYIHLIVRIVLVDWERQKEASANRLLRSKKELRHTEHLAQDSGVIRLSLRFFNAADPIGIYLLKILNNLCSRRLQLTNLLDRKYVGESEK